ncbi:FixH family protein [Silvimonas iriomotensis]|uniref:Membrane protein n=1 Tax=Silvimonas iriomotensis TaxID=449662 RepID=A0ABQ2P6V6_9NEIS|nr:FixH family protein [Silvimonas iriomotensis]GGP19132.1 membrane protein [Silvimonas iriomotensis]
MARLPQETQQRKPWYREPGPWLVALGPACVVVGSLFCVYLAFSRQDDLVTQNYYQAGLTVNQRMHEDEKARALGLDGQLTIDVTRGQVALTLDNPEKQPLPPVLQLDLAHPTQEKLDQHVVLSKTEGNSYIANIEPTKASRWHVTVQNEELWRMEGEWDAHSGNVVRIQPTSRAAAPADN